MKKFCCSLLAVLLFSVTLLAAPAGAVTFAPPFEPNADAVYLVNLDTGIVVYEKNADKKRPPASLTKLMTTLLLLENVPDLDGTRITAPGYIFDELFGVPSSTADIRPYEEVSARDLLYAMMLPSANEAASTVADYLGGGNLSNFFYLMNNRARELGCTNTNFTCAHGLYGMDQNHYSSARDMYLIAKACYDKGALFMDVATTLTYAMPASNKHNGSYKIFNTNFMMRQGTEVYRSYIQGIKTGSTPEAGYNLITTAKKDGQTYMLVVMGTPYERDQYGYGLAFSVTAQIYDWVFDSLSVRPALDTMQDITEIKVKYCSEQDTLKLRPASDLMTLLPIESDETTINKEFHLPETVTAPIEAGDVVGSVTLSLAGEEIGTVDLIASQSLERNTALYVIAKIGEFFSSLYFKVLLVLILITVAVYVGYILWVTHKNKKMGKVDRRRSRKL
ncbi:D-alanyl-D-alanine carboxypeptidase [Anaerofilum sp. BX8]|uniref:serine-type D-Ala-D-Ala carboxypeptidase n=1 Tax=Anaerofilum hominis TaxID=2763016 RepID=A0A923L239_9FIRM|nr:D-alanyl-D-alanine carboxypeptidase family protein [Anaerofilum hominis]MBC5582433.1 D-alanyl-D-alanine carboxypeptidase [Anaerofilum hominis]